MSIADLLIVLIPMAGILALAFYMNRYIQGVPDFLSAGRLCRRYLISVGDIANSLSILGVVAFVEIHYKTGFALTFWNNLLMPISIFMGLTGYCLYRFRETKAMSIGQFLEIRYSRSLRIFAATLRSITELLANMIMPAIAARFFIYLFGFPTHVKILGVECSTFMLLVTVCLTLAIFIICVGGQLALIITDSIQGLVCYPLIAFIGIFIFCKFSWGTQIIPVMFDRVPGENFLNPYDISKLSDFNLFFLLVTIVSTIMHRASWLGTGGSSSAISAHEEKMAGLLGAWRNSLNSIFYVVIAIAVLTFLNHRDFAAPAKEVRTQLSEQIMSELQVDSVEKQNSFSQKLQQMPEQKHQIGVDAPLSDTKNLDTPYIEMAKSHFHGEEKQNSLLQQFKTLYHQGMLAVTLRNMLPAGMLGLFCLMMVMAMVSTDDTRIFSAALTIAQDIIMPLRKKPLTPKQHIWMIRLVSIGCGVFFFVGSNFMAQLDYINLYSTIVCTLWMGGCGPLMIFGLYSRFGTTAGAWSSLLTGMGLALGSVLIQRNWADFVYPVLQQNGWTESTAMFLSAVSGPFNPYIVWEMNPVKCPINSYEFFFIIMMVTLVVYCVVSLATFRGPFNLDRMLHRGKYNLDHEDKKKQIWTLHGVFSNLIGINPSYTRGDKVIAWGFFGYSFVYQFLISFIMVVIWNLISPWKLEWWGYYFLVVTFLVPGFMALISTFWFGIGFYFDFRQLRRDLKLRKLNVLDDGRVEGSMSLADKTELENMDKL